MGRFKITRLITEICLILILILIPVVGTSCSGQQANGIIANTVAASMVPDVNLDAYLYFNQGSATNVPKNLLNAPQDIPVDSFALWGVIEDDIYAIGGAFVFTSASDASTVYSQIPAQNDVWKKLADKTIYLVQGSGSAADKLQKAISNNNFKRYNDQKALAELARMPYSDTARPAAVIIIKPTKAAVNLVKSHLDPNTASTIDSAVNWGKPQIIVCGLYSSQKLDIAEITHRIDNGSIWDMNLGVMVLIDSSLPGFIISPIAGRLLDSNGFTKGTVENLTVYQTMFSAPGGKEIPVLINLDGNQLFVTSAAQKTFARELLTGIKQ